MSKATGKQGRGASRGRLALCAAAFAISVYGVNARSVTASINPIPAQWQAPGNPAPRESMAARQQAFVARIMAASRPNGVIMDARMNRNNELGVVLSPRVRLRDVRPLMTSLLRQMHRAFPNQPLTVISYAPNGKAMATMRYDPYAPPSANVTYRPNF